jgi:hypothetical protein
MTPERIEFWKNNLVATYQLHDDEFDELMTIDPKDLQYQNCDGYWIANVSTPLKNESLAYRLRPDYVEPQSENTREPLPPWACPKDAPNCPPDERDVSYIGGISELAAAGITADSVPDESDAPSVSFSDDSLRNRLTVAEAVPTEINGIKIETGEDRVFATGAKRQASAGKGLPSLLPPDALLEISKHLEAAASKYGSRNWEKGLPLSSILDSLLRHIYAELMGDTSEEHARAIGCNTLFYIATKKRIQLGQLPSELDDIPKYLGTKQEIKNETV